MSNKQLDIPLSFAQEQLWFIDRLAPRSSAYNVSYVTRLRGDVDINALHNAVRRITDRHDILRSRFFISADGTPRQRLLPDIRPSLVTVDLSSTPVDDRHSTARVLIDEWAEEPFELENDTLARFRLVHVSDREHLLGFFLHHAVCDGWSMEVLFQELRDFYASPAVSAPTPAVQYADYVHWQRELLSGPYLDRQLSWWRDYLSGVPTMLAMPEVRLADSPPAAAGAEVLAILPRTIMDGVSALARAMSTTPFTVLLAAYALLVAHRTGMRRFLIGTLVAGRSRSEFLTLIGLFVNTVPIRVDLDRAETFGELVTVVRESVLDALSHDQVPLGSIVDAVHPQRAAGRTPLIQTAFTAQTSPPLRLELAGLETEPVRHTPKTSKFDMSVSVLPSVDSEDYELSLVHDSRILDSESARELVGFYCGVVTEVVESPESKIEKLIPGYSAVGRAAAPAESESVPGGHADRDAPPQSALEHLLLDVWREVLKGRSFGIHDNFFDIGGQSLALAVVHARMERHLGRELPMIMFYEYPTIVALAAHLSGRAGNLSAKEHRTPRRQQSQAQSLQRRRTARDDG
jgi:hypothetical protein